MLFRSNPNCENNENVGNSNSAIPADTDSYIYGAVPQKKSSNGLVWIISAKVASLSLGLYGIVLTYVIAFAIM